MKAVTYFLFLAPLALAGLQARAFTFDGTLKDASDNPVTASAVHFKFQVRTPGTENCLLYEEAQTIDMTGSNGRFALAIGNGTGTRTDSHSWDLYDVFSNRAPFSFNGGDCTTGNSYTPGPTAPRMAQVSVDYGAGWETFPAYPLDTVPTSMDSYSVGGFPAGSLLRVADSVNLGNTSPISSAQYTSLLDLMNGNSGLYAKTGELGGSTLPTLTSGQSFVSNGSGGWTAFTPLTSESDPTVQAFAKAALPVCSTGEVLKSNGAVFFCVTDSIGGGSASSVAAVDGMNTTPSISFASDSDTGMYLPSADAMGFTTGGTEKMRINAAGKVGIGTTFPETSLQISASATSYGQFMIQDPYNPSSSAGLKTSFKGVISPITPLGEWA